MKNMNTKYFMILTLLTVGSVVTAREVNEGREFKKQMHHIQDELYNVRHHARENSKMASNELLARIKMEIQALDKNPEFKDVTMRGTHIDTLNREVRHAENIVKHHGLKN